MRKALSKEIIQGGKASKVLIPQDSPLKTHRLRLSPKTHDSSLKTFPFRNIRLILEYDGARYSGFQRQPVKPTIQSELEKALRRLFGSRTKIASASGRTDAGVHASGQIVNFKTQSLLPLHRIWLGINFYLPKDIAVRAIEEVPAKFHARFNAKSKVYEYRIWNDPVRSPLRMSRTYQVPYKLDLRAMRDAAAFLKGRHDFSAFCSTGGALRDPVRTILRLELIKRGNELGIRIEADGFLYHMVRNIAGTLIEVGRGRLQSGDVRDFLLARKRHRAIYNAPPHALTLVKVSY